MQRLLAAADWDAGWSATTCAPTSSSTWATRGRCWWWTRPGSSRRAPPRWGCSASTRARRRGRELPAGGLPGLRQRQGARPSSTGSSTCPGLDRRPGAGGRRGVPEQVEFRTKPQLAQLMLERALDAGVPATWVTATRSTAATGPAGLAGGPRPVPCAGGQAHRAAGRTARRGRRDQRRASRCGAGRALDRLQRRPRCSKGRRLYDWARVAIWPPPLPPAWLAGCWCAAAAPTATWPSTSATARPPRRWSELVRVAGTRWAIEEGFEQAKGEVGLDHYEVRGGTAGTATSPWPCWPMPSWPSPAPEATSPERTKGDTAA